EEGAGDDSTEKDGDETERARQRRKTKVLRRVKSKRRKVTINRAAGSVILTEEVGGEGRGDAGPCGKGMPGWVGKAGQGMNAPVKFIRKLGEGSRRSEA
ncbi:hypothetical protein TeGR_g9430, partial [Tetraparma gracilis]